MPWVGAEGGGHTGEKSRAGRKEDPEDKEAGEGRWVLGTEHVVSLKSLFCPELLQDQTLSIIQTDAIILCAQAL